MTDFTVKAIRQGYFNSKVRNIGDPFTLKTAEQFSAKWMEKTGAFAKAKKAPSRARTTRVIEEPVVKAQEEAVLQKATDEVTQEAASVIEAPVVEAPVVEAPVVEAPVVEAPVVEAPAVAQPAGTKRRRRRG